ncbi:hypothetical protein B0T21DRAFT_37869 [Apiosordaria backusii]|uniref:Uncharacterized protein n=1 Tax=Apiosordaria backusii TaxID=314023 RepID=A0AA40B2T8_9PEZI|nr:hypothetical protein B0T21DRAFT_37869 [Apiosordaria backusii]
MTTPDATDQHSRPPSAKDDLEAEAVGPPEPPSHNGGFGAPRPTRSRAALTTIVELSKTKGGLILKALSVTSLLITVLALWQTISTSADAKRSTVLAEWTAKKEFLEFCEAVRLPFVCASYYLM